MTNACIRPRVLLFVALAAACSSHATGVATQPSVTPPTVEILNQSEERIDVYLVAETQHWRLGRVEPLAKARLPLPADAFAASRGSIRLAVLPNATYSIQPSRDPRAVLTLKQAIGALASQQWVFASGQLVPLPRP
jgi:hypothetical protein